MCGNFNVEDFFNGLFDGLNTWITKFNYLTGIGKDHMIMIAVKIGFLVLSLIVPKLVLTHQPAFKKKFNGVIQGSSANPVFFILHLDIQRFNIKMIFTVVYLL